MYPVQVSPPNLGGFAPSTIERMNNYLISKTIDIDKEFYKYYLNILKSLTVNDAKQLIHIFNTKNHKSVSFDYHSEEDILINLTTIVYGSQNPTLLLQDMLRDKFQYRLPSHLHSWIENDLSAMLFFVASLPTTLTNKAFSGGEEFSHFFMNFIQFNVFQIVNAQINYCPIEFSGDFNLAYWIEQYETYKKWYLDHITPKKNYKWLEKCEDEQLDKLLDNLSEKKLRILEGIFYPQSKEDKIALIMASINRIEKVPITELQKIHDDVKHPLRFSEPYTLPVRFYHGYFILPMPENIELDREKYEGLGIPTTELYPDYSLITENPSISFEAGTYESIVEVGKYENKIILQKREFFLNQLRETARKQKTRATETLAKEERTVTILKKNMPKLQELATSQNMTINQFTNKIIEVAYETKVNNSE